MISAVVNTYNAQETLRSTLSSLCGQVDEIVLCDMQSTDDTLLIARDFGCKIITHPRQESDICESARNFAFSHATAEWVLVVDADEVVTHSLLEYLRGVAKQPNPPSGIYIPRKNHMLGVFTRSSYPDYQLRFFKRQDAYWPPTIHSKPIVSGRTEHIAASREDLAIVHAPDTMERIMEKWNRYSTFEATKRKSTGQTVSWSKMFFSPLFRFIKVYFLKGGFRYGKVGIVQAYQDAFYKLLVMAKMIEK